MSPRSTPTGTTRPPSPSWSRRSRDPCSPWSGARPATAWPPSPPRPPSSTTRTPARASWSSMPPPSGELSVAGSFRAIGKLGSVAFSPDGERIAAVSAADPNDPAAGRLIVLETIDGEPSDLLPDFEGPRRRVCVGGRGAPALQRVRRRLEHLRPGLGLDWSDDDVDRTRRSDQSRLQPGQERRRTGPGFGRPGPPARNLPLRPGGPADRAGADDELEPLARRSHPRPPGGHPAQHAGRPGTRGPADLPVGLRRGNSAIR